MRKPIAHIGSEYQTDDLDLEDAKIIFDYGEVTLEEGRYYDAELYGIDKILVKSQNNMQNSELIFAFKVFEDESEHILEAIYTCNGDKPIVKNKKLKELFLATLGIIPNVNGIDLRKALLGKTCKIKARSKYIDGNIEIYDVKNASIVK
ncbi:TPA: hypothetical protein ACMVTQ_001501 [Clostridioides difficile]|uniref:hypothetical protein n=1 Tax=Clostridioides difficile TaxID=1496 RepID=UPI00038DA003|nr:hypothetical protein [Clostridioides difficile]EQG74348.1 hypothetical protein QKA_3988 [Clostridioides difficile DA00165]EAA0009774.1 hypothetical protein [Clostridioides difficile]EGT3778056.1 hypothetical protein [Clostridioides difficile]EGT3819991.1 hypothetical protein [Clostridioides difficile]EGT3857913.1 hypothetical protein [Clostridioides difficile]